MRKTTGFFAFFAIFLQATFAFAQFHTDVPEGPLVKVQLIAENDAIKPGQPFDVALRQEITAGWHTYWKNPGDSGLATGITWQLPTGFTASELMFPTPHRQPTGGLVNYGYNDSVMILTTITPPADLPVGGEVQIQGKANWLVCAETCIPEEASFLLTLPVSAAPQPGVWSSAFAALRKTLPQPHTAKQTATVDGDNLVLTIDPLPLSADMLPEEAYFFPHDEQLIKHSGEQKLELDGRRATLTIPRNTGRKAAIEKVTGDLMLRTINGESAFQFDAVVAVPAAAASPAQAGGQPAIMDPASSAGMRDGENSTTLFSALLAAFLGGMILNLMPCVFPVLSLKALGLVQQVQHDGKRRHIIAEGVVYTLGVLVTFSLIGFVLVTLKHSGEQIGWGFQLQSPRFVAALALLLFAIGYVLSGAVTVGSRLIGVGQDLAAKKGLAGAFFTGALAVVVATPCTAPFMGGAIFYALTQPAIVTLIVLWALGFGLALPYLLLSLFPAALRLLPRPGLWMEHFKQFLAFPMFAASIWLVWVLAQQAGASGVLHALITMLLVAFALWLYGTTVHRGVTIWHISKKILAAVIIVLAIAFIGRQPTRAENMQASAVAADAGFENWSDARLQELRSAGKPVFVDMTAAWCITCLANDKAALSSDKVRGFFKTHDVTFLKGDWTNMDPGITAYLKSFNRSGVPIYVFYPADQSKAPVLLPQILTPNIVIDTIAPYFSTSNPVTNPTKTEQ